MCGSTAAFDGDPRRVTRAGQSAGAGSVEVLMSSPLATGLFSQGITQSYNAITMGLPSLAAAERSGSASVGGTRTLAQPRAMSPGDLLALPFQPTPVLDGRFVPRTWRDALKTGTQADVPLLSGMVTGDRIFFALFPGPFSFDFPTRYASLNRLRASMRATFGGLRQEFSSLYPAAADAEAGSTPTYLYRFSRAMPDATGGQKYGAFHSSDLAYTFDYFSPSRAAFWTADDRRLGEIASAWPKFYSKLF